MLRRLRSRVTRRVSGRLSNRLGGHLPGVPRRRRPGAAPGTAPGTPTAPTLRYAPRADGRPDPGEVVWGWVPYEEDPQRGKDRPVLLVGTDGEELLGLMLTSKDHDRDAEQESRWGRYWMDVGTGGWDRQRRPSEVRLDRLLRLRPDAVRREGAALDPAVFASVIDAARRHGAFD